MKILVPLDGSLFAEWAIPVALGLAGRADGKVVLLSVDEQPGPPDGWLVVGAPTGERLGQYLEGVVTRIREVSQVPVSTSVREGPVVKAILAAVEEGSVDLVVLTTHGRGPLTRMWLGSVADNLVRHATTPVLLVRPGEAPSVALAPWVDITGVLVPLDGSREGEQCFDAAVRVCGSASARYHAMTVVPPARLLVSPYLLDSAVDQSAAMEAARVRAGEYLDRAAGRLREKGAQVDTEVILDSLPASAVITRAESDDVDIVVMSTHGRGGVTRLLLGSVADKVVRAVEKPVLLCREQHY
jgi:nucleotide-binding universal stress UspA family protein